MLSLIEKTPDIINGIEDKRDVIVLVIAAKRNDGEHIVDAQKDAAMDAAKSVLQIVGAEVSASSTSILLPIDAEEQGVVVKTSCEIWRNVDDSEDETNENDGAAPEEE